jgi:hypothetical protein
MGRRFRLSVLSAPAAWRTLIALGPGELIGDFDVSRDGHTLVFDRVHEESGILRIDLAR